MLLDRTVFTQAPLYLYVEVSSAGSVGSVAGAASSVAGAASSVAGAADAFQLIVDAGPFWLPVEFRRPSGNEPASYGGQSLVTYQRIHGAGHVESWNLDPEGYQETVERFLLELF